MTGVRKRGEMIRDFILDNVREHPKDITALTSKKFAITRQAINHHIRRLTSEERLKVGGSRTKPKYELLPDSEWERSYALDGTLEEDAVWRNGVRPMLDGLPENVIGMWEYGVTEMVNNSIDHSTGKELGIYVLRFRSYTEIMVSDDGIGIFKKIKAAMNLDDERHAVLELAKGKFTTDPDNHTGEGIFFSSRMFDDFDVLSGDVYYSHDYEKPIEWINEAIKPTGGTAVFMDLKNDCPRTVQKIFDEYAGPDEYEFAKTVVPVRLAQYGDETLVSRSQAKRLLARIDRFKSVIFDFEHVTTIGQAFSDEIFRVFANRHPEIEMLTVNTNKRVQGMIKRAIENRTHGKS